MSTTSRYRPPDVPAGAAAAIRAAIVARRTLLGLSQAALSTAAGLSPAAVGLIESGRSSPGLGTLYALATALGCTVADLVECTPKKNPKKT